MGARRHAPMSRPSRQLSPLIAAAAGALIVAPPASAATTIVAKGAGYGHGVGMSQYGAYGQAKAGRSYKQILALYYQGTEVTTSSEQRSVRVLLQSRSSVRIKGAVSIVGSGRRLSSKATYVLRSSGSKTRLTSAGGKSIASANGPIRVAPAEGGAIRVSGNAANGLSNGRYRGSIELRDGMVINQVGLEDYVRGVVSAESPSSWPTHALRAQAIAARTYAITTAKSSTFHHYADTRSQMYRGVAAETATTDAAVSDTRGMLVTYRGKPIVTYFFSTSGGRTENVEYSFLGSTPKPYLRSVLDPWDKASPKHRWQVRYSRASLQRKLGSWVKGTLRSIDVIKRGVSPRVIRADIVGSRGRTSVSGPQLRARLGLNDTWVQFVFSGVTPKRLPPPASSPAPPAAPPSGGGDGTGGASLGSRFSVGGSVLDGVIARPPGYGVLQGRVWPDGANTVVRLQTKRDGRWRTAIRVRTDATGAWTSLVPLKTRYRVVALGTAGPTVTARH